MEKEEPSLWASNKTNLFCEILAVLMNNFIEMLEKQALKIIYM